MCIFTSIVLKIAINPLSSGKLIEPVKQPVFVLRMNKEVVMTEQMWDGANPLQDSVSHTHLSQVALKNATKLFWTYIHIHIQIYIWRVCVMYDRWWWRVVLGILCSCSGACEAKTSLQRWWVHFSRSMSCFVSTFCYRCTFALLFTCSCLLM